MCVRYGEQLLLFCAGCLRLVEYGTRVHDLTQSLSFTKKWHKKPNDKNLPLPLPLYMSPLLPHSPPTAPPHTPASHHTPHTCVQLTHSPPTLRHHPHSSTTFPKLRTLQRPQKFLNPSNHMLGRGRSPHWIRVRY